MLLLTISSFFSFMLLNPAAADPSLRGRATLQLQVQTLQLQTVCQKTSYPTLCASTLATHIDEKVSLTDPVAVFQVSLKAALAEATAAIPRFDALIRVEKDKFDRGCLVSCKKDYSDAIDNIKQVMKEKDPNAIASTLSASISYISTCGNDFGENRVNKAAQINQRAMNVIDNSLALAEVVNKV